MSFEEEQVKMRPPANETASFGVDLTNIISLQSDPAYIMCNRLAGRGIVRVVGRCKDAQENSNLGKFGNAHSGCKLIGLHHVMSNHT